MLEVNDLMMCTHLKEERERDPLVVLPVAAWCLSRAPDSWVSARFTGYREGRVDPAVCVQYILRDVPG
ncbi:unnamed protein product [Arctia plantaginis]|uniref:Uncharacterized protein n=1 Tax=Arctia plantaginis TaxID=874455 RepID=A0A8S0YPC8_ARCPL|nr:unnamed protein product [Arctia plantaginis]